MEEVYDLGRNVRDVVNMTEPTWTRRRSVAIPAENA